MPAQYVLRASALPRRVHAYHGVFPSSPNRNGAVAVLPARPLRIVTRTTRGAWALHGCSSVKSGIGDVARLVQ
jgi:hypothetical protein